MYPGRDEGPFYALEVDRRSPKRPIITLGVIAVMVILLSVSFYIYLRGESGIVDTGQGNGDNDSNDLMLRLDEIPGSLISNSKMSFKGEVFTGKGTSMEGTSIAVRVPGLSEDTYRSYADPEGRFQVDVMLPPSNLTGIFDVEITAEKEGLGSGSSSLELGFEPPPKWTFMVYMSDCDLEAWALKDLNEMEGITSSPLLDIIVQLDRWESLSALDDRSDGNWTTAKRFRITEDGDPAKIGSEELIDIGEVNTADPDNLVDFTTWTMERYPADRYGLVLWNHGSGVDGICWEQSLETEEEVMEVQELGTALERITSTSGNKLDLLGFDACLMSTIEVAYEIAPYADILVGSEITEPAYGWNYRTLQKLGGDPYMLPEELGYEFMMDYMLQLGDLGSKNSMTMGVYDLAMMDDIASALNDLSNTVADAGSTELYNMRIARKYAQPIQEGHSSDAVDLYDLVENLWMTTEDSRVKEDARTVLDLIEQGVLHFSKDQVGGWPIDGLNGLSIYSPDFKEVFDSNEDYSDLKMSKDTSWTGLLLSYYESMTDLVDGKVLDLDTSLFSCSTSDGDGDGCRDTMRFQFTVRSTEDTDAFLGINVFNIRGDHITDIGHSFNITSGEPITFTVTYRLDPDEGGPGLYRIAAYLCSGNTFDQRYYQDYTRSGYRWLEVYIG